MLKNIKKNNKGFTIIEVLIVLAIAGLIMVIVFLAVPALQRNSRNTSYKNEAARTLAAANEFVSNNSGNLPAASTCTDAFKATPIATDCDYTTTPNNAQVIWQSANPKNIKGLAIVTGSAIAVTPTLTTMTLDTGAECPVTVSGTTVITPVSVGTPTRSFALIYAVEDARGNAVAQCQNS